jgi:hypothetical protein
MTAEFADFLATFPPKEEASTLKQQASLAYSLYAASNYREGETLFRHLVTKEPLVKKHWFGLSSTLMMQRKYEEALMPWAMTALLGDEDPMPHFHAGECLFCLGQKEEAKKALLLAKERAPYDEALLLNIQDLIGRCS